MTAPGGVRVQETYTPRLTRAERQLARTLSVTKDLRPVMRSRVAPIADAMLRRHWESKGRAYGRKWAEWAPSTRRARVAKGNASDGLLLDSKRLYRALFRSRPADSRLQLVPNGIRLSLNTQVAYARFLQRGTRRMPARQVIPIPFPDSFKRDVRAAVRGYLAEVAAGGE